MRFLLILVSILIGGWVLIAVAQTSPQDQLAQCTSLLRVKQDTPCRCDQVEGLAATLLRRAEKAEQQIDELHSRITKAEQELVEARKETKITTEPGTPKD